MKYLISQWVIILIAIVIGGLLGIFYAVNAKPTYTAQLTFVLSNETKSSSGIAGLAGQLGMDIGGMGGSSGAFDGDNIVELLRSRRIIKGALFRMVPQQQQTLVNLISKEAGFIEKWGNKPELAKLLPFPNNVNMVQLVQDSLVDVIHRFVVKKYLNVFKLDKKLSFYVVNATSSDEYISNALAKYIVDEAAKMYIDTKTKTAKDNLIMLTNEADSLRNTLKHSIYSSATRVDQTFNLNSALQTERASIQQNQFQTQVVAAAYTEVIKNLELAKIALQKDMPLYQVIDSPSIPLQQYKPSKFICLVVGSFLACILSVMWLTVIKKYKDILPN